MGTRCLRIQKTPDTIPVLVAPQRSVRNGKSVSNIGGTNHLIRIPMTQASVVKMKLMIMADSICENIASSLPRCSLQNMRRNVQKILQERGGVLYLLDQVSLVSVERLLL